MTNTCLCLFAKAPISGKVKTRLLPALSEQQACRAHKVLLQHCIAKIQHTDWQSQLWSTDISDPYMQENAQQYALSLHEQHGLDLGERMANAAQQSLENFDYVVIVGTDCPSLDITIINDVVKKLQAGVDVVLGPATDGGYVLIGLSVMDSRIFTDINWGSGQVLELTRTRLQEAGLTWYELAEQRDIDRPDDLYYLQQAYPDLFHSIGVSLSLPQSDHEPG